MSRICRGFRGLSSDWRAESAVVGEACRLLVSSQDTVVAYLLATDVRLCCSASRRPTPTPVSPSVCVLLCFCITFTIALLSEDCAYGKKKGVWVYRSGLSSSLGCRFSFLTEFVREEVKKGRPVPRVNCLWVPMYTNSFSRNWRPLILPFWPMFMFGSANTYALVKRGRSTKNHLYPARLSWPFLRFCDLWLIPDQPIQSAMR